MNCPICKHGKTRSGSTTVTLERNGAVIVIKAVPAEICENCGEYYLSDRVTEAVYAQAESAIERKAEVEVVRFAA